ncbi:hypothetical protein, partial [[Scytonema hofmanni] UTEX B 1581]
MNYLEWNLDMEEGANLYDPVGNIKISGDEGIITEEYTYIDAFFEAFVEGVERMKVEDIVRVDPLVEPNDIIFSQKNSLLEIKYGSQKAIIFNKSQFLEEVKNAVTKLIEILDEFADSTKQERREMFRRHLCWRQKAEGNPPLLIVGL